MSPVSTASSRLIYDALKASGIRLMSALPETWLVHLVRMADEDPDMILVRLAKEEEGVGISAGAQDRKSTRLNSSHLVISYAVFCLKKKKNKNTDEHTEQLYV